jgi:hypothetical protein
VKSREVKSREVKWEEKLTGYSSKPTTFLVTEKTEGTAPDITIYQSGEYSGGLVLSQRAAKRLADTLYYMLGKDAP